MSSGPKGLLLMLAGVFWETLLRESHVFSLPWVFDPFDLCQLHRSSCKDLRRSNATFAAPHKGSMHDFFSFCNDNRRLHSVISSPTVRIPPIRIAGMIHGLQEPATWRWRFTPTSWVCPYGWVVRGGVLGCQPEFAPIGIWTYRKARSNSDAQDFFLEVDL
jgi:hypothetical protein